MDLFGDGPAPMKYFVHSFAPFPADPDHIGATISINGLSVPVAVRKGNVTGVQFHPEKSGPAGLRLLKRFTDMDFRQ